MNQNRFVKGCFLFGLIIFALYIALHMPPKNATHAQIPQEVTLYVYHLCDLVIFQSNPEDCEYPEIGVGTIRSIPGAVQFDPWLCQSTDPLNYSPYDFSMNYGCGFDPVTGEDHYPSNWANPVTLNVEEYLYDVVTQEMDPDTLPMMAVQAGSVAARSKILRSPYGANNSVGFQAFIPYRRIPAVFPIVDSTVGQIIQYNGEIAVGSHLADHAGNWTAQNQGYPNSNQHLKRVFDPEGRLSGSEGEGLSQWGACRWVDGYNISNPDWCRWNQQHYPQWVNYKQILAHYYTGIDLVDANNTSLMPDWRWNALVVNVPSSMTGGQLHNVSIITTFAP